MTVWPIYGAASVLAIGCAALADKDERYDRVVMALILFMGWCAAMLMHMAHISATYPIIDLVICYTAFVMMVDGARPWKYVVFGALLCQLVLHAAYQAALLFGLYLGYYYLAALNALFVCQLVAVSARGAKRGFDDWMGKPRVVLRMYRASISRASARLNDDGTRPRP